VLHKKDNNLAFCASDRVVLEYYRVSSNSLSFQRSLMIVLAHVAIDVYVTYGSVSNKVIL